MGQNKPLYSVMRILLSAIAVLLLSVSIVISALPQPNETKEQGANVTETSVPDVKATPAFKYNPFGKPDPFRPFMELEPSLKKKTAPRNMPISPLQMANINDFRLVGVSSDDHHRIAMVQDVKGRAYPVFVGTYIGQNGGRVVEILPDRVIIEEKIKAADRKAKAKRLTMKLRKDEGEELP